MALTKDKASLGHTKTLSHNTADLSGTSIPSKMSWAFTAGPIVATPVLLSNAISLRPDAHFTVKKPP
jgi:hypothetical protein